MTEHEQVEPARAEHPKSSIVQSVNDSDHGHAGGHAHLDSNCVPEAPAIAPAAPREYPFPSTGSAELDKFFASSVPYLRGELAPSVLEDRLGPSASGTKRLNVYPWIVLNDNRGTINKMFAACRAAVERHKLGLWDRMMNEYQRKHPPADWRIHRMGEPMYEFLKGWRESHPGFPEYIEQLADCAFTRGLASNSPRCDDPTKMIDRTIFVRQYTHTVPQFIIQIADDPDAPSPEEQPTLVIIYRSLLTLRGRMFYPGVVALLALARRTSTSPELRERFTQVSDEQIDQGEATLIEFGVLPPVPASS